MNCCRSIYSLIAGTVIVVCFALASGQLRVTAGDEPQPAASNAPTSDARKLVVHEWGTFTSFSGSNGVQLDFRPLINADLPNFVSDFRTQAGVVNFSKSSIRARVRMETPVTYFYTDRERTVRASVGFPQGLLTEFYPPVETIAPTLDKSSAAQPKLGNSKLDWGEVHLIPAADISEFVKRQKDNQALQKTISNGLLPQDNSSSRHYYYARETDSAVVHVRHVRNKQTPPQDHFEKFLFYRGVGKFDQPLNVVVDEGGRIHATNKSQQLIRSLFRVTVEGKKTTVSELEELAAGKTMEFPSTEKQVTSNELQSIMSQALVREHLYPREAAAMVKTWADSWFAEEGTRIFYVVPPQTTDQLLPLTITPTPDETVRILVGRVEIMLPSEERRLTELVRLQSKKRTALVAQQAKEKKTGAIELPIPSHLIELGRLAEPALVRVQQLAKDDAVSREATLLLQQCRQFLNKIAMEQDRPVDASE